MPYFDENPLHKLVFQAEDAEATLDLRGMTNEMAMQQVERLIARAAKVGAWGQAEEYCRSRFNGAQLVFALAELGHAKEEARSKKTERQAA